MKNEYYKPLFVLMCEKALLIAIEEKEADLIREISLILHQVIKSDADYVRVETK